MDGQTRLNALRLERKYASNDRQTATVSGGP